MEVELILSFFGASVLLALSPGPDNIFVLTQSLSGGSRVGIIITLGLGTGIIVHTLLAATGVSLILSRSDTAFTVVKYLGALYLLYLAWEGMREQQPGAPDPGKVSGSGTGKVTDTGSGSGSGSDPANGNSNAGQTVGPARKSFGQLYRTGILMNVLNPKVALFFIALFPAFLTDGGFPVALQMVLLGILFMVSTFLVFGGVALLSGKLAEKLSSPAFWNIMRWVKVAVLAGLALVLALSSK